MWIKKVPTETIPSAHKLSAREQENDGAFWLSDHTYLLYTEGVSTFIVELSLVSHTILLITRPVCFTKHVQAARTV